MTYELFSSKAQQRAGRLNQPSQYIEIYGMSGHVRLPPPPPKSPPRRSVAGGEQASLVSGRNF